MNKRRKPFLALAMGGGVEVISTLLEWLTRYLVMSVSSRFDFGILFDIQVSISVRHMKPHCHSI